MPTTPSTNGGDLPFATTLFETAIKLRGSVESAEYKHLVLGLIFVKYISDAFEARRKQIEAETRDAESDLFTDDEEERAEILEDRDEYISQNVFWVPEEARWESLLASASQAGIGAKIDTALEAIERDNVEQLRGVLPRIYARSSLPAEKMGQLVETVAKIGFGENQEAARDVLGRVYEYFIREFARAEGRRGGEFYTPASVTRLLVEMLEPYEGRVFDPACGSGGLFIQSAKFVEAHGGRVRALSLLGQESIQTTWRIARMNLAIHGLSADIRLGDSLLDDQFPGVRADFVLANPPFNLEDWGQDQVAKDARWSYGVPPNQNANYAWIQHFIHHLAPDGRAGFVLANGSLTTRKNGEHIIRENIVRADVLDCVVTLPGQLFFTTPIPVCLWFIDKDKASANERDRQSETLFIDARRLGRRISRTQIELSDEDIARIVGTYHAWRKDAGGGSYEDQPGFCKSATIEEIEAKKFLLTPGFYTGAEDVVLEDDEPLEIKIPRLIGELETELEQTASLERQLLANLERLEI